MSPSLHLLPLAGFAGLMTVAACEDLRRLTIPNPVVVALCALWPVHLALVPGGTLAGSLGAAACAAVIFAAGALLFSRGLVGGGDVKLLAAATLWAGPEVTPALVALTALLGGALALLRLSAITLRTVLASTTPAPASIPLAARAAPVPYGVAIASAALVVTLPTNLS
jgi:prepilin peptidase CpaA